MKQLALIKFLSAATIVCAADVPITQDELVRRTQELYDALVPGNQAPGQTRSVTDEGDKLFVERNGKKEQLLPEASELFFGKGVEGRILFRYAANGKVDALIDRRNNEDVVWRKTTGVK
jgi:hypothetical protein